MLERGVAFSFEKYFFAGYSARYRYSALLCFFESRRAFYSKYKHARCMHGTVSSELALPSNPFIFWKGLPPYFSHILKYTDNSLKKFIVHNFNKILYCFFFISKRLKKLIIYILTFIIIIILKLIIKYISLWLSFREKYSISQSKSSMLAK